MTVIRFGIRASLVVPVPNKCPFKAIRGCGEHHLWPLLSGSVSTAPDKVLAPVQGIHAV